MELHDESWIDATHDRRLLSAARAVSISGSHGGTPDQSSASSPDSGFVDEATAAVAVCETIGSQVEEELSRLRALDHGGISATFEAAHDGGDQIHAMVATVESFAEAVDLADVLVDSGYRRWQTWTGGALGSFRRTNDTLTVARTAERTDVVNIQWNSTSKLDRVPSVFRPNEADWSFVSLPAPLWWLYFVVRPIRLVAERVGLVESSEHLGPFLATPASLIDPLLEFASVTADDVVVDLGCGDGRLVIEAAKRRGCRGRGIETDTDLVDIARSAVHRAGLSDSVEIIEGDAASVDLGDATVVFVFLPADVAATLIPEVVRRLAPGARVVAHEQHRLNTGLTPQRSVVLIGDDEASGAVTVAHRWG